MKALASSFMAMLFLDTISGDFKPLTGQTFLPSPRRYLATFLMWGILGLTAGFGPRAPTLSGRIAWLAVLTGLMGVAGRRLLGFVDATARLSLGPTEQGATP